MPIMTIKNSLWQLATFVLVLVALNFFFKVHILIIGSLSIFVLVLVALNFFFKVHILIIGSLLLTIILSLVFNLIQTRR